MKSKKEVNTSIEDMPIVKLKKGVETYEHDPSESQQGPFHSSYLKFFVTAILSIFYFYWLIGSELITKIEFDEIPNFTIYSDIVILPVFIFMLLMASKYLGKSKKIIHHIFFIILFSFIIYLPVAWYSSYANPFSSSLSYRISDRLVTFVIYLIAGVVGPYWGAFGISILSELFWTHLEDEKSN